MKNPFTDFRSVPCRIKDIPLEGIIKAKRDTMERLFAGYLRLVEEEAKDLIWIVEQSRVGKAYEEAIRNIGEMDYDQDDIEEFCSELDSSNKIPYMISGPAGIYISALINCSKEADVELRLNDYQRTFHFLGYRLPEGKRLHLKGNVGDFIGAGLDGGRLLVEGSAGNWCGAGMRSGLLTVKKHVGQKTGEWMRGGEIHVDGWIQSIGRNRFGGKIFQQEKLLMN